MYICDSWYVLHISVNCWQAWRPHMTRGCYKCTAVVGSRRQAAGQGGEVVGQTGHGNVGIMRGLVGSRVMKQLVTVW
jgi:hypothetical protein